MTAEKKPWQTGEVIKLETIHFALKEPRTYVFKELNQEYGSRLLWKYVIAIVRQWPKIKGSLKDAIEKVKAIREEGGSIDDALEKVSETVDLFVEVLPVLFSWDSIAEMAGLLLSGHTVEIDGEIYTADGEGFSGTPGDPIEIFNAMFFAMCVNWPKYFSPLLGMDLKDLTRDSGQQETTAETAENISDSQK